jgi:thiol:disulfide interchange protein DsbD
MLHFKVAMAFPMFATVVWLVWVLGQQTGIDGAAALLLLLLVLAFLAWVMGATSLGPASRRVLRTLGVLAAAAALFWAAPAIRQEATAAGAAQVSGDWQPWSVERVAEARAAGQAVFVDFTAAWCVSCQVNERTTLALTGIRQAFAKHKVLLLRADWTRRDPLIAAELMRLGRQGVPVYALYPAGDGPPRLLNEILTPGEVRGALAQLPGSAAL